MSWVPTEQEVAAMLTASDAIRYTYFVKRVADTEELWGLKNDQGWVMMGDDEGHEVFPVWPHPKYAQASAHDDWAASVPTVITLESWLSAWLPGLERDGRLAAVFPTSADRAVVVTPAKLRDDLEAELELYE